MWWTTSPFANGLLGELETSIVEIEDMRENGVMAEQYDVRKRSVGELIGWIVRKIIRKE